MAVDDVGRIGGVRNAGLVLDDLGAGGRVSARRERIQSVDDLCQALKGQDKARMTAGEGLRLERSPSVLERDVNLAGATNGRRSKREGEVAERSRARAVSVSTIAAERGSAPAGRCCRTRTT